MSSNSNLSRRNFLKGSAALAAGLMVAPKLSGIAAGTPQPGNFSGVHFPLMYPLISFSNPSQDSLFTTMLQSTGAGAVRLYTSPAVYSAYRSRFMDVAAGIQARGLQLFISEQPELAGLEGVTGVPPSYPTPPTVNQYETTELATLTQIVEDCNPDLITVVAEPQTIESRIGAAFSVPQWTSICDYLSDGVSDVSASVEIAYQCDPVSGTEVQIAEKITDLDDFDLIGFDCYDHVSLQPGIAQLAQKIQAQGIETGITETWWEDLFTIPYYDNPANAPYEEAWISSEYAWAAQNSITADYCPFYSNKYVSLQPLPALNAPSITAYASSLSSALSAGVWTADYTAYKNLIASING